MGQITKLIYMSFLNDLNLLICSFADPESSGLKKTLKPHSGGQIAEFQDVASLPWLVPHPLLVNFLPPPQKKNVFILGRNSAQKKTILKEE